MKKCDKCCFSDFVKKDALRDLKGLAYSHVGTPKSFGLDQLSNGQHKMLFWEYTWEIFANWTRLCFGSLEPARSFQRRRSWVSDWTGFDQYWSSSPLVLRFLTFSCWFFVCLARIRSFRLPRVYGNQKRLSLLSIRYEWRHDELMERVNLYNLDIYHSPCRDSVKGLFFKDAPVFLN